MKPETNSYPHQQQPYPGSQHPPYPSQYGKYPSPGGSQVPYNQSQQQTSVSVFFFIYQSFFGQQLLITDRVLQHIIGVLLQAIHCLILSFTGNSWWVIGINRK